MPVRAIREQIASAIDVIVHESRFSDGSRKVTHVTEIVGLEGDQIAAASLDEGLAAVADGTLAPETLRLTLHEKPELGTAGTGVLLRLRGRELSVRRFATGSGYGPPREVELGEEDLRALAGRLAALSPARLPANLHAPGYLDLTLEVLGHRIAVQARRFAGMTAATHGDLQRDFDRLLESVRALGARGR